jgi:hypothetical protein
MGFYLARMSELYIHGRIQVNDKPAALDRVVRAA